MHLFWGWGCSLQNLLSFSVVCSTGKKKTMMVGVGQAGEGLPARKQPDPAGVAQGGGALGARQLCLPETSLAARWEGARSLVQGWGWTGPGVIPCWGEMLPGLLSAPVRRPSEAEPHCEAQIKETEAREVSGAYPGHPQKSQCWSPGSSPVLSRAAGLPRAQPPQAGPRTGPGTRQAKGKSCPALSSN